MDKKKMVVISENCEILTTGLKDTQDLLKGKWKPIIIQALNFGVVLNFSELKYYLTNISAKVLTHELRDLEQNFLIKRTEMNTKQPTVIYSLTEQGKSLFKIIEMMSVWGREYRKSIYNQK